MARDWETQFRAWARPPSATETQKMERAEKAIRDAIAADAKLQSHDVHVYAQGSYYNRTNVSGESDVDIRVEAKDVLFPDWYFVDQRAPVDRSIRDRLEAEAGLRDVPYDYSEFKVDVGAALVNRFGPPPAVERGDKAFDIHENTYRVESDCLPAFRHVRYARRNDGRLAPGEEGIEFISDKGIRIINFPEQQHSNGIAKHDATGQRFKKMVRVLKNLRNEMNAAGRPSAAPIVSFLSECLVYNVPTATFGHATYYEELQEVLRYLYLNTETDELCSEWGEESDLRYLFRGQSWTREQANDFVLDAWRYVGFQT